MALIALVVLSVCDDSPITTPPSPPAPAPEPPAPPSTTPPPPLPASGDIKPKPFAPGEAEALRNVVYRNVELCQSYDESVRTAHQYVTDRLAFDDYPTDCVTVREFASERELPDVCYDGVRFILGCFYEDVLYVSTSLDVTTRATTLRHEFVHAFVGPGFHCVNSINLMHSDSLDAGYWPHCARN